MKRNKQSKYRMKIIQQWHLNKLHQNYLDNHIVKYNVSYKILFEALNCAAKNLLTYAIHHKLNSIYGILPSTNKEVKNIWEEYFKPPYRTTTSVFSIDDNTNENKYTLEYLLIIKVYAGMCELSRKHDLYFKEGLNNEEK